MKFEKNTNLGKKTKKDANNITRVMLADTAEPAPMRACPQAGGQIGIMVSERKQIANIRLNESFNMQIHVYKDRSTKIDDLSIVTMH